MEIGSAITLEDLKQLEKEEDAFQEETAQVEIWKQEIEECIKNLSEKNADKLIRLFDKNSPIQKFRKIDEINYIAIWVMIFAEEKRNGINDTIFSGRKSLRDMMSVWRRAYFLLWRVEFENEANAKDQFLFFLKEERISLLALQYLLYTKSAYPVKTGIWLVKELMEIKNFGYAKTLLLFLKQLYPTNDEINRLIVVLA